MLLLLLLLLVEEAAVVVVVVVVVVNDRANVVLREVPVNADDRNRQGRRAQACSILRGVVDCIIQYLYCI
jgi:hypothetical protein